MADLLTFPGSKQPEQQTVVYSGTIRPREVKLPGDLRQVCGEFLHARSLRGAARNTIDAYRVDLEQLVGYLEGRDISHVQLVGSHHLDGFIDALLLGEGVSPRTAARKQATVKALFKYAVVRGLITATGNPAAELLPIQFTPASVIAPEADSIERMICAIPLDDPLGVRDVAIFRLMADAALRIGGVASLDLYDPDVPPPHCIAPGGVVYYRAKGGRTEDTVISDERTAQAIDAWLEIRSRYVQDDRLQALFLSERGTRLTRAALHYRIKKAGERVGMPDIHCHLLRHRRIGDALEQTDLHVAQYLAGHKDKSTTVNVYGTQSRQKLRERIRRQCPMGEQPCK